MTSALRIAFRWIRCLLGRHSFGYYTQSLYQTAYQCSGCGERWIIRDDDNDQLWEAKK